MTTAFNIWRSLVSFLILLMDWSNENILLCDHIHLFINFNNYYLSNYYVTNTILETWYIPVKLTPNSPTKKKKPMPLRGLDFNGDTQ